MNAFHDVLGRVSLEFPGVYLDVSEPVLEEGYWIADILYNRNPLILQWSNSGSFGLTSLGDNGFGQKPDEIYSTADEVFARIVFLLKNKQRTQPPLEVTLRELRARRNFSQAQLAAILGVEQPAVSRLEGRLGSMRLSSLQAFVRALGGKLNISVELKDGVVCKLRLEEEEMAVTE